MGLILAYVVSGYIYDIFSSMPINMKAGIHPMAVLVSFFVAIFAGWIFGMYPAQQAAKLQATEALREK